MHPAALWRFWRWRGVLVVLLAATGAFSSPFGAFLMCLIRWLVTVVAVLAALAVLVFLLLRAASFVCTRSLRCTPIRKLLDHMRSENSWWYVCATTEISRRIFSVSKDAGDAAAQSLIDAEAIPTLVGLLSTSDDLHLVFRVASFLVYMARYSAAACEAILETGVIEPLLERLRSAMDDTYAQIAVRQNCSALLAFLLSSGPPLPLWLAMECVRVLAMLVQADDQGSDLLQIAMLSLYTILPATEGHDTDGEVMQLISGVYRRLLQLLAHDECCVQVFALKVIQWTIERGDSHHVAVLLEHSAQLKAMMSSANSIIWAGAYSTVATIVDTGAHDAIQSLIDGGFLAVVAERLAGGGDGEREETTKIGGALVLHKILANGSQTQGEYVAECGCIDLLCGVLDSDNPAEVRLALMTLDGILRVGEQKQAADGLANNPYCDLVHQAGGVAKVQHLALHGTQEFSQRCVALLQAYFPQFVPERPEDRDTDEGSSVRGSDISDIE
ncbi:unnamed protein product [Vitrella brassicaformis CCMP3155]|uniref:Armadillo repeat-containing domain-containing protein n=2 Tax=Vitrella brassicaformis TaxID=1169539 RepID=A0A0G4EYG6_VITBC|nr:unnamed protein product [Vitrella brassicaformis CCMP3155]|eukprot:CEM04396.1 unnamed protein product [Vitrella brassicaformis CCMP3155]